MSLLKYFFGRQDLGIDLGTANTLIYVKEKGIAINEPSIVTYDRSRNKLVAIGTEAQEMMGKVHPDLETIRPIQNGVVADLDITEQMLARALHYTRYRQKCHPTPCSDQSPQWGD